MKHLIYLCIPLFIICSGCDSSEYSKEEQAKLEEAQKLHNESLALFSETKELLAEVTEVRADLVKRYNLQSGDSLVPGDSLGQNSANNSKTQNSEKTSANQKSNQKEAVNAAENSDEEREGPSAKEGEDGHDYQSLYKNNGDSTNRNPQKALDNLNKAHGDLMEWMRDIYGVPNMKEKSGYEDQKAKDSRSIGKDPNSAMLSTNIEVKQMPEGSSVDEIHKKQKEQKEAIESIREELTKALQNARGLD